uniref:J domain-containing protein n=1 Tax=Leersia perrieri TaxID=77586 RepID=A0A0D9X366_9ORYZ
MAVVYSPSSAPEKRRNWLRGNRKQIIGEYLGEARAALAAAAAAAASKDGESGGGDDEAATAALGLVDAVLEMSPRMEAALELRARSLLALRRYRDIADMLRDYIPSCAKSCSGDDTSATTSSSSGSRTELLSPCRDNSDDGAAVAGKFLCCFDFSELKQRVIAGFSKNAGGETQWRYLILGEACFHLGLMEDAAALLQTGRRLASAAFRRESVCWSDDSFSGDATSSSSSSSSSSQLLAHVKLLLRRRAAAVAAHDAGLHGEAVRHFTKVLDARRGGVLPHPFATACLVGRAEAFRSAGRAADAVADCNRALALDPAFIPALRTRADLFESIGAAGDALRDLEHLKLLYDAALRDGKLPGPTWRPQGGVRFGEIAAAHRALAPRIQRIRAARAAAGGEACGGVVDYYALLGVRRGCARSELERAHLLLTLKLRPDRCASFAERLELVDEHRDIDAVRDQARMSALSLYRMLQKGYSFIMSVVIDEEAAERQRAKDAAAAAAAREKEETALPAEKADLGNVVRENVHVQISQAAVAMPTAAAMVAAAAAAAGSPVFQGVFCRDMAVVGNLLSRGGFDRPMPVKCEAMSC